MLGIYVHDVKERLTNGAWLRDVDNANFSTEWSRLINEAGRWCESYASDLLIDFESIKGYLGRLVNGEETEGRDFWFGFRASGVDGSSFIESRTKDTYASHVYRAVWVWSFTVEETEYGPYIRSELKRVYII